MTGEKLAIDPPQPGDREPAPGQLAVVQAFMNTHYDLTTDPHSGEMLVDGAALGAWLAARALIDVRAELGEADVRRAIGVREGLRALAYANNDRPLDEAALETMRRAQAGAAVEVHLEPGGPRFTPRAGAGLDGALGALLAIAARAMLEGTWPRLKACPGRECGWAFFDHSRNQSARWCAMKICGDREKARAYYRRKLDRDA
jgi:predicted RNA-binding Zn ribbon-like protein